jgi:deazaflavin-dependent oxidoreductase (nitroreductase family)
MPSQRQSDRRARIVNKVHQKLFNVTKGRIGYSAFGVKIVALTTTGRKTGQPRTTMVGGPIVEDDMVVVVASYAGSPTDPQWFLNLKANPQVQVTYKNATLKLVTRQMTAREAIGDERATLWRRAVAAFPKFEELQMEKERQIPVVVLEPVK